jgi:phosphomannomutase
MKTREWQGSVIRSVATSHMIDKVADMYGLKRHETPVGFKFIGEIMTKEDIIIGGEESNGLTVHRHVPEKDGIIACLLVAEMAAREKKSIRALLRSLEKKTGPFYNTRKNLKLTEDMKKDLMERVKKTEKKFGKYDIKKLITIDGYKFMLGEDTWTMIRFSGTEPVVRLYGEAKSEKVLRAIIKEGEKFVFGK